MFKKILKCFIQCKIADQARQIWERDVLCDHLQRTGGLASRDFSAP